MEKCNRCTSIAIASNGNSAWKYHLALITDWPVSAVAVAAAAVVVAVVFILCMNVSECVSFFFLLFCCIPTSLWRRDQRNEYAKMNRKQNVKWRKDDKKEDKKKRIIKMWVWVFVCLCVVCFSMSVWVVIHGDDDDNDVSQWRYFKNSDLECGDHC